MPTALARPTAYRARLSPHSPELHSPEPPAQDQPSKPAPRRLPVRNRVRVLLVHIPAFSIQGQARLARDAGVARSTISRLVNGRISPSYRLAQTVTEALERKLGQPLNIQDVFTLDGTYPTPSGCMLCGCYGCLPAIAWGEDDALKPEWKDARPGDWSLTRLPEPAAGTPQVETRGVETIISGKEER